MRRWITWIGVGLLVALTPVLMGQSGCRSPLRIDEQTEVQIGQQAAADIEREYGLVTTPAWVSRVQRIGNSIARVSPRPQLPWSFRILNVASVNAVALPGGPIYVTRGLMEQNIPDAELAGVLAHEVAHVTQRHSADAIERAMTAQLLSDLVLGRDAGALRVAADLAIQYAIQLPRSRQDEFEADAVGIRLAYNANYPAGGLVAFLERLNAMSAPGRTPEWMRTHPLTEDRIARARQTVAQVQTQPRPVPVALTEQERELLKQLILEDQRNPRTAEHAHTLGEPETTQPAQP